MNRKYRLAVASLSLLTASFLLLAFYPAAGVSYPVLATGIVSLNGVYSGMNVWQKRRGVPPLG